MPPREAARPPSRTLPRALDADEPGPARGPSPGRRTWSVSADDQAWLHDLLRRGT